MERSVVPIRNDHKRRIVKEGSYDGYETKGEEWAIMVKREETGEDIGLYSLLGWILYVFYYKE